ncbi:L-threonylcarbamoyladenylate synthase [Dehalococcoidia bacterium]|nr:L-threonylcarbamoyladenylate synthase [Dehalococcoidia bacterium]
MYSNHHGNEDLVETDFDGEIERSTRLLAAGGVIAIPTDTFYGLAARAFDVDAVLRVFHIKGRGSAAALPLLLADPEDVSCCADSFPPVAQKLAERFWPGALTIVLPKAVGIPDAVTGGGSTVALRVPNHLVPRQIARSLGNPITGTSANLSGAAPARSPEEVSRQLGDKLGMVFNGGTLPEALPSTVVDLSFSPPKIVRSGAISSEELGDVMGTRFC